MQILSKKHEHNFDGPYDFVYSSKIVTSDTGTYLVRDIFCGGDLEGQCPRPHVLKLDARIEAALDAAWDGETYNVPDQFADLLEYLVNVFDLDGAKILRADGVGWADTLLAA